MECALRDNFEEFAVNWFGFWIVLRVLRQKRKQPDDNEVILSIGWPQGDTTTQEMQQLPKEDRELEEGAFRLPTCIFLKRPADATVRQEAWRATTMSTRRLEPQFMLMRLFNPCN
eukprot:4805469-Amphidinium_carterae.1